MIQDWSNTTLFQSLKTREDASVVVRALQICMPLVQDTLKSGVPHSPDFTLHDDQHGFRVAESMAKIAEPIGLSALSAFELALLLLSAYCHDIGMTPGRDISRRHYNYLLTAEADLLTPSELTALQSWLDEAWGGVTAPIATGPLSTTGLQLVEEISAYYGRHRHNDWSEDWIRRELSALEPSPYPGWIDDLVTLCRSHHDGITELRGSAFDARLVGTPPQAINLRYLAAILRVADVVEFDPERTPSIILRSRDIAPKSRIYWYKDHAISFAFSAENFRIIFSARTPSALVHRAVLSTAEWVDAELSTCCALAQEGAFSRGTIPEARRAIYSWPWPAKLTLDVAERDERFVYIDGSFRPSTERILSLLSGTALYGDTFAAIRELLQNSLDAVREQIAYERLQRDDPSDPRLAVALGQVHTVRLGVFRQNDRYWLECSDSGVGMTREIIERHLLVSGSDIRPETRALERNAYQRGFSLDRTGQFGIGVLSYFMLADHVDILTRRSQEAGDTDGRAWRFRSDGIGSFGELSSEIRGSKGTTVRLRLSDVSDQNFARWLKTLLKYVDSTLRWTPCRVEIRDDVSSTRLRQMEPGWTWSSEEAAAQALESFDVNRDQGGEFISPSENQRIESTRARWREVRSQAEKLLRWTEPVEVALDDNKGIARISLPYFELEGGASVAYFDIQDGKTVPLPDGKLCITPAYQVRSSWRGFSVGPIDRYGVRACVEIDYRSGRKIKVDRAEFSDQMRDLDAKISLEVGKAWWKFVQDHYQSFYNSINRSLSPYYFTSTSESDDASPAWVYESQDEEISALETMEFPLIDFNRVSFLEDEVKYKFQTDENNEKFSGVLKVSQQRDGRLLDRFGGGRVIVHRNVPTFSAMIGVRWECQEEMMEIDGGWKTMSSEFPPEWAEVLAIQSHGRPIINRDHPAFSLIEGSYFRNFALNPEDLDKQLQDAVKSSSELVSFLLSAAYVDRSIWNILSEKYSQLMGKAADLLKIGQRERVMLYRSYAGYEDAMLVSLSRQGIVTKNYREVLKSKDQLDWIPSVTDRRFLLLDRSGR